MQNEIIYDVAVIGGGLAGLSVAIASAQKGASVILIEKEKYPFHKVCGEYISMESWNYLEGLGIDLSSYGLPKINKLNVTSPSGNTFSTKLIPGGFGISRFTLDAALKISAESKGVNVIENCRADNVEFSANLFSISTSAGTIRSKVCTGSFGKKSNLDVKWKRPFTSDKKTKLNNFIGVKYHVIAQLQEETIFLHNFENGYCGISKIENDLSCMCYLTTASNLKKSNNSIEEMEEKILSKNPHLRKLFSSVIKKYNSPLTISQISFEKKSLVHDHILLNGDAAGMISPLCGNGMSMALHSGKILSEIISRFLKNELTREEMERAYIYSWKKQFSSRLFTGRIIQSFFGKSTATNFFISAMKGMPSIANGLIKRTHGDLY